MNQLYENMSTCLYQDNALSIGLDAIDSVQGTSAHRKNIANLATYHMSI